ncbi:hypothetical protein CDAR_550041 [Caerostris darwini]|uniref:Uncharacterized protein n=1 Tax=Caerostris darwini TaxID=1538125 RepID=A0AAV4PN43_9ARAC|nr:hypothetical protein CDAR_550041 [Caerostris darwini]
MNPYHGSKTKRKGENLRLGDSNPEHLGCLNRLFLAEKCQNQAKIKFFATVVSLFSPMLGGLAGEKSANVIATCSVWFEFGLSRLEPPIVSPVSDMTRSI